MSDREHIIFCDESDRQGTYYSNFYGGLIVGASQYQQVSVRLNALKQELHLFGEIKWERVSDVPDATKLSGRERMQSP